LVASTTGGVSAMTKVEKQDSRPETNQVRHKTLSAYCPHLITLHDYILTAPRPSTSSIILETDSDEYKRLVLETICASRAAPVNLPPKCESWGSHQEVVDRILMEIARRCTRKGKKDVLISSDKVSCQSPII
jgi:hypothetical protein